ncbi:MAG: substrate-binding domain-containing protein [Anaerolineae bacterium]|nr:substrate-binding domain-containing protein [Anaerolineae bacterium]
MADPNDRRITINDVARQAGVSYQTVSRVINGHPYVARTTRARVLQAITELGYQPNKAAKSLASSRSHTLGLIVFGMAFYGPTQMVINIERAARAAGYDLIFSNLADATVEAMEASISALSGWRVEGILAITPVLCEASAQVSTLCATTPYVQIDINQGSPTPSVIVDQAYGSRLITQHLIDLGHTQICEISGPMDWFGAMARHESWLHTLADAGLTPGPSLEGDWSAQSGYQTARQLLDRGIPFTALVAGNDQMALGAIRALRERGLRIPRDVSIVGFDDIPEAIYFDPPLTTIKQDFDALGKKGIEYLMDRVGHPDAPPEQRVIYPRLVERESTAPPLHAAPR